MSNLSCSIPWCTSPHSDDTPHLRHHSATVATHQAARARVIVRATDRTEGPNIAPHLVLIAGGAPGITINAADAVAWAWALRWFGVDPWLPVALDTGARILDDERAAAPAPADETAAATPTGPEPGALVSGGDERLTWQLIIAVFDVLERHGYRKGDDIATGRAVHLVATLTATYEGTTQ